MKKFITTAAAASALLATSALAGGDEKFQIAAASDKAIYFYNVATVQTTRSSSLKESWLLIAFNDKSSEEYALQLVQHNCANRTYTTKYYAFYKDGSTTSSGNGDGQISYIIPNSMSEGVYEFACNGKPFFGGDRILDRPLSLKDALALADEIFAIE